MLDELIAEDLRHYGWFCRGQDWKHDVVGACFNIDQLLDRDQLGRVAYWIRQFVRWTAYNELSTSPRHELVDQEIPPVLLGTP